MKKITILLLYITFATSSYAQPGTLDTTFGYKGKSINTELNPNALACAAALQQSGKILIANSCDDYNDLEDPFPGFYLSRYNTNGGVDFNFAGSGTRSTTFLNAPVTEPIAMAVQSDQKIIQAGSYLHKILIARYSLNGNLDKTFSGSNGKVTTNLGSNKLITITSTLVQPDYKIIVGGYISDINKPGNDFYIARYNADGTLDKTFGTNGSTTLVYNGDEKAMAMALQTDGKIIQAGYADNNSSNIDFAITRYNSNGLVDLSFGFLVTTGFGGNDYAKAVAIQSNGKIVVAGYSEKNNDDDIAIARYNTNGTLDNNFAGNGKLIKGFGKREYINAVAIQTNGKIVAGGYTFNNGAETFLITRFKSNGKLDSGFNKVGKATANFIYDYTVGSLPSVFTNVLIQTDGKIVCAGYSYHYTDLNGTIFYTSIARFNGDAVTLTTSDMLATKKDIGSIGTLKQNFPNPFTSSTTISYSLPVKFSSAQIIITDKSGISLKKIDLSIAEGTIHIDGSIMGSGTYYYSLYVDGKLIDSKQMIAAK